MGFAVALSCPRCGGTIECDEADHLLLCPFCHARSFVTSRDFFRYVLPWQQEYATLVFAPYLRFRGAVYLCRGRQVDYSVVDVNHLAAPLNILPATLGLRPQAMKMRFVEHDEYRGSFLRCFLSVAKMLEKTGRPGAQAGLETVFHRAYIGETMSLIYLPLAIMADRVVDAVTGKQIARLPDGVAALTPYCEQDRWEPGYLAALCPNCGADLAGEKDSVAMLCGNCQSIWESSLDCWAAVDSRIFPSARKAAYYLPFWAMTVQASGLEIKSYADFLRISNQPRVVRREWEQREMRFWAPAFKITPKIFLRLASQLTIGQPEVPVEPGVPPADQVFPVTLPRTEAMQSLKIILANSSAHKKDIMPRLPATKFSVITSCLVYLPFQEQSHELFQETLGVNINRQSLAFGRLL